MKRSRGTIFYDSYAYPYNPIFHDVSSEGVIEVGARRMVVAVTGVKNEIGTIVGVT